MDHVRWDERPRLRRPILIAAFEGWNDAAEAATTAARYLRDRWGARPFASMDPEEFYDFSSTRPEVKLADGFTRQIIWPANQLSAARLTGEDHDVVLLIGTEPQLRWRTFTSEVVAVAQELGVELRLPRTRPRLHPPGTPGPKRCNWPWTGAYISYQGYAMPCCMVATPDRVHFGSVAERGVEATWNGDAYQAFRRQLGSDEPPDVCRSCAVYSGTF